MQLTMAVIEMAGLAYILYVASQGFKKVNWEYLLGLDLDREEREAQLKKECEHRDQIQKRNLETATEFANDKAA